jgi:hypothetical protein
VIKAFMFPAEDLPPDHLFPMSLEADQVAIGRRSLVFSRDGAAMLVMVDRRHVASVILTFDDTASSDEEDRS